MPLEIDLAYACPYCGETNYIGVDPSSSTRQRVVEDCPVCCSPIVFAIRIDHKGDPRLESAERE